MQPLAAMRSTRLVLFSAALTLITSAVLAQTSPPTPGGVNAPGNNPTGPGSVNPSTPNTGNPGSVTVPGNTPTGPGSVNPSTPTTGQPGSVTAPGNTPTAPGATGPVVLPTPDNPNPNPSVPMFPSGTGGGPAGTAGGAGGFDTGFGDAGAGFPLDGGLTLR